MLGQGHSIQMLSHYQGLRISVTWYKKWLSYHWNAHTQCPLLIAYLKKKISLLDFSLFIERHLLMESKDIESTKPQTKFPYLNTFDQNPSMNKNNPIFYRQCRRKGTTTWRYKTRNYCDYFPWKPVLRTNPSFELYHHRNYYQHKR